MSKKALNERGIPHVDVVKRAARIGTELANIRLSGDLPDETVAAINNILLERKVLFFRDQGHLDDAELERFAHRFGELVAHPTLGATQGAASTLELDSTLVGSRVDVWHSDSTFVDAYPKITILRGLVIPPLGGDTVWSNTVTAYVELPPPLQRLANELWSVHTNDTSIRPTASEADKKYHEEILTRTVFETEHPVVRVHPETSERALVLGHYVRHLIGVPKCDGQKLLDIFQSNITAPENTVRWKWKEGDVAVWDNRATQHYAINDYGSLHRVVRRVTIAGDRPVGIDGRCSVTRIKAIKQPSARGT